MGDAHSLGPNQCGQFSHFAGDQAVLLSALIISAQKIIFSKKIFIWVYVVILGPRGKITQEWYLGAILWIRSNIQLLRNNNVELLWKQVRNSLFMLLLLLFPFTYHKWYVYILKSWDLVTLLCGLIKVRNATKHLCG